MSGGDTTDDNGEESNPSSAEATSPPNPPEPQVPDSGPGLPSTNRNESPAMATTSSPANPAQPEPDTWYRSDQERSRSVYRRANPLWRRVARGLIALGLLGLFLGGIYFGAIALQDYLGSEDLPAAGAEVPNIRSTTFQVASSSPAPTLDGTLTLDRTTSAFEFRGRTSGPQAGIQVVSTNGAEVLVRNGLAPWQTAGPGDSVVSEIKRAMPYLIETDNVDTLLPSQLRRGYADLEAKTEEGVDENAQVRYDITLDTASYSDDYPLQWQTFQREAIPGAAETRSLPVTLWLDTKEVVVRLSDNGTNWNWERLSYSATAFFPENPLPPNPTPAADDDSEGEAEESADS